MDWKSSLESLKADLPLGEEMLQPEPADVPQRGGRLCGMLDRKGRKGKDATIVEGFECSDDEVGRIASLLKQKLGVGGSARGGEILIQGDKREPVAAALSAMGYTCKIIR